MASAVPSTPRPTVAIGCSHRVGLCTLLSATSRSTVEGYRFMALVCKTASAENLTGGWFDRNLEYNVRTVRDARLTGRLDEIHRDRATEPVSAGVVFGAAHIPAVAAHLCGKLGYIAASSEWLTVHAEPPLSHSDRSVTA